MPILTTIAIVSFIFWGVIKFESEYPTQNYYKPNKEVTNEEYKDVLDECKREHDRAIDLELYINPGNYSHAGHLGEYAEDEWALRKTSFSKTQTQAKQWVSSRISPNYRVFRGARML